MHRTWSSPYGMLLLVVAATGTLSADETTGPVCHLDHCVVSLIEEVEVPAQEAGQLLRIEAEEGALVPAGSLLAQIEDEMVRHQRDVADADLQAASEKAASDVAVRHAKAAAKVAAAEYAQAVEANRRQPGTISQAEERRRQLSVQTTELQIEQSILEQRMAHLAQRGKTAEVAAADASLARRQIEAPFDGLVVEVAKRPGEWVQPGEMVLRLVRMDRLRIEGFVRSSDFDAAEIADCPVDVEVALARGRVDRFVGKIVFVDPLLESGGEYRVWAEVENRSERHQWLLRPGAIVGMTIDVAVSAAQPDSVAMDKPRKAPR